MIPVSDMRRHNQQTALPSSEISESVEVNQQNKYTLSMTHTRTTAFQRLDSLATNKIKVAVISTSPTILAQIYHNMSGWPLARGTDAQVQGSMLKAELEEEGGGRQLEVVVRANLPRRRAGFAGE